MFAVQFDVNVKPVENVLAVKIYHLIIRITFNGTLKLWTISIRMAAYRGHRQNVTMLCSVGWDWVPPVTPCDI
jgi:hypothetical protein